MYDKRFKVNSSTMGKHATNCDKSYEVSVKENFFLGRKNEETLICIFLKENVIQNGFTHSWKKQFVLFQELKEL